MSWDSYVTNMEGEGCQYAGIFDQCGNKWAESKSTNLKITPDQIDTIVKGLKTQGLNTGQSVKFGDHKYLLVDKTDETAVLKQMGGEEKMMACVSMFKSGVCVGAACGEKEKCSRVSAEKYAAYLKDLNM